MHDPSLDKRTGRLSELTPFNLNGRCMEVVLYTYLKTCKEIACECTDLGCFVKHSLQEIIPD